MNNQENIRRISIGILSLMLLFFHALSSPVKAFNPPGSSITNTTICNNQLPYHWNGLTCLTAGTYSATLTGTSGSDSVAVLNLSVINVGTSISNVIVCDNELPYPWNGNNYSASGTYSVTLTSSSGCDSVPILSLTVNHVVTSTSNRTVCSNQLPYNWNGNNYPGTGTYTVTLTSAAGCDSIATLNLTVNQVSASGTSVAVCLNQLPYHWNGNTYTTAGTYSLTLLNSAGCDSVASLVLTTKPSITTHTSVSICNNQLPYSWNGNNYAGAGDFIVTLTGSNGCDSIAFLHLTIILVATSTSNVTICNGQLPYQWNGNNYAAAGTYSVLLTASNGCDSIATLRLTTVTFLTSNVSHTVCNSALPYHWNGNDYNSAGTYTASFVTAAGCDSVATLHLAVTTPQVSTDSISICESALPYNWHGNIYTAGGTYHIMPPVVIDACHSIDTLVLTVQLILPSTTAVTICNNHLPYNWNGNNYTSTGIYGITLSSSAGCDSLANLDLTVNPAATSVTDLSICSNQLPYHWNGNNFTATGVYPVTLTAVNGCDSIATLRLIVNETTASTTDIVACNSQLPYSWNGNSYTANGTYTATLVNSTGCDSVAILHFVVAPFLTSTINTSICSNQLPYSWNGNTYLAAGVYSVNLTSSAGCDSVATLNLVINDVITSTTNINTCTNQLPYNWNGNTYTTSGSYIVTLITSGGCDSVATLNLVVNNTLTSNTETTICNNQLPYSWNGNSYPVGGLYHVTLTGSGGCDSIATINLIVTDILTSTTNVNVCPALLPYHWNGNSYPDEGTYSVTLSTAAGCDSVPILSLTVVPYVTSTTDIIICENQLPYQWNGNTYPAAGTYSVLLTGISICDSLATLNLLVAAPITSTTAVSICENLYPYTWNGNEYPGPGNYSVTLTASGGCDSTATLLLTSNPVATSNTMVTICENQLPYSWNGNLYSVAGPYTVVLVSSLGCDSVATLNLFTNPVKTSFTDARICTTQLPYTWNGNLYAAAGTYVVNLVSITGCDSVATLHLTADPTITNNIEVHTCENQLPYSWNGNNYAVAGNYPLTFTSSGGCDSIAMLQLIINPVATSITNVNLCNNLLPYSWNGNNYTAAGIYMITLNSAAGCDSVASLKLIVNQATNSNFIASTCENQLPYLWNGQPYTASGNYSVTLTNSAGCDSIANLMLQVYPTATSLTTTAICSGALPFNWNGQNYTTAGIHTVTLISNAGCDSVATLDLAINPTPPAPVVQSPLVYCQQEIVATLTATVSTAGNHLLWYTNATGGTGTAGTPLPSTATSGTTNYYVSQVQGPCESPRSLITVTVNSKPVLGPDKPLKICFGDAADLAALYNTNGYNSTWSFGQQPVANPTTVTLAGTYQLVVQTNAGCTDTALVTLSIQPPVTADAGPDGDAEYNVPYQLSGSGGGLYEWSPAALLNNPFIANPLAVLTGNTTFILIVKDEIGCAATDTVKLRVLRGPTFYVPTAFTPNGDNVNDIFKPTPIGIESIDFFRVFNRYGELVYETHEIGKGWDGTYKGLKQNIGNYVWSVKGTDRTGKVKILKGNVILIR